MAMPLLFQGLVDEQIVPRGICGNAQSPDYFRLYYFRGGILKQWDPIAAGIVRGLIEYRYRVLCPGQEISIYLIRHGTLLKRSPSFKELRTSVKYRSKEYLLHNSLHGVPYFVDPTRPKWERAIWFILTMGSVGATIAIIITIWDKFQNEPTISGLDIDTDAALIPFPHVFLCFNWNQLNHSVLDESEMHLYEKLYNWREGEAVEAKGLNATYAKKTNFRDTLVKMIPNCGTFFSKCSYRGKEEPCDKIFHGILASPGACCEFKATKPMSIVGSPWELSFLPSSYNLRVYLMDINDVSPQRVRPMIQTFFPFEIQFKVWVTYPTSDMKHLAIHQRNCIFSDEGLSFTNCAKNCTVNKVYNLCNCVPWFINDTEKIHCTLDRYSCVNKNKISIDSCECVLYCDTITYVPQRIIEVNEKDAPCRIRMVNWINAVLKREILLNFCLAINT
ncbi:hypothetical protein KM043_014961 [Ampulex compressa]|nr:hypothetical protein KM043_014961 [Ampulex compressa]